MKQTNTDYKIYFFRNPESPAYDCHSFIGKGTLNEALHHTKERMKAGHFLKADIWAEEESGRTELRHSFTDKEAEYIDMLITPSAEEVIAGFSKPRQYEVMYPATDGEVLEALQRYGGFNEVATFERIGHNVVIADEAIAVALKPHPENVSTLYVIDGQELPLQDDKRSGIAAKVWATPAVLEDLRKAEERLLAQLHKNK